VNGLWKKMSWWIEASAILIGSLISGVGFAASTALLPGIPYSLQSIEYVAELPPPYGLTEISFALGSKESVVSIAVKTSAWEITIPSDLVEDIFRPDVLQVALEDSRTVGESEVPDFRLVMSFGDEYRVLCKGAGDVRGESRITQPLPCVCWEKDLVRFSIDSTGRVSKVISTLREESEE